MLYVNRGLAGGGFPDLQEGSQQVLHSQIHNGCDGSCRFNVLWRRAWKTLRESRESIEWEIDDEVFDGRLRLNLTRPPTSKHVAVDRRQRFAYLTVTDITETRQEYEAILRDNEAMRAKLRKLGKSSANDDDCCGDDGIAQTSGHIIAAREDERQRIAADLHDGIVQSLGAIKFGIEAQIEVMQRGHPEVDVSALGGFVDQIREAIEDVRDISRDLSPSVLNEFGICVALEWLCTGMGSELPALDVSCNIHVNEASLPGVIKVAIYRVAQEALNNIKRHSGAESIGVILDADEHTLSLTVRDDGRGFDVEAIGQESGPRGLGLGGMRQRVESTGGVLTISSMPGDGSEIRAEWSRSATQSLRD